MKSAATIASTYGDIDLNELIQESNEIAKSFGITDEQALALIDHLLEIGFPTDQLDIITEYGSQLERAGFDAQQIQAILASGADTGSWNVDVLLDGLKEARITMSEFGQGVDETTAKVLNSAGISSKEFQQWGKDIAAGGKEGAQAYQELGSKIASIKDPVLQNQIGVMVYGTLWEENGTKITDTITNMNKYMSDAGDNQDKLNEKTKQLDENPAVKMSQAMAKLKEALQPVLGVVADVVSAIADFVSEHPQVSAAIAAIAAALTIVIGIVSALAPIVTAACAVMGAGFAIPLLPILAIVAAVAAVIAIGVLLYKNWDTVKEKAQEFAATISEKWNELKQNVINAWNGMVSGISSAWSSCTSWLSGAVESVISFFTSLPERIGTFFSQIPEKIAYALGYAVGTIISWGQQVWSFFTTTVPQWIESVGTWFSQLPGKIWSALTTAWSNFTTWGSNMISSAISTGSQVLSSIGTFFSQLPGRIWNFLSQAIGKAASFASNMASKARDAATQFKDKITNGLKSLPDKMKSMGKNIITGIWNGIKEKFNSVKDWCTQIKDKFMNGLKDALGIHSPSTVMRDEVGTNITEGISEGMTQKQNVVEKAAGTIKDAILGIFKKDDKKG